MADSPNTTTMSETRWAIEDEIERLIGILDGLEPIQTSRRPPMPSPGSAGPLSRTFTQATTANGWRSWPLPVPDVP
jgi:hypothetical protein